MAAQRADLMVVARAVLKAAMMAGSRAVKKARC